MDNYGGSADQLVIMQIVTYNRPAKLGYRSFLSLQQALNFRQKATSNGTVF